MELFDLGWVRVGNSAEFHLPFSPIDPVKALSRPVRGEVSASHVAQTNTLNRYPLRAFASAATERLSWRFLSLDDDVRKYIPVLPDYGHTVTLRQMLHRTSGLGDFLTLLYLSGRHFEDMHSRDEILDLIARQIRVCGWLNGCQDFECFGTPELTITRTSLLSRSLAR